MRETIEIILFFLHILSHEFALQISILFSSSASIVFVEFCVAYTWAARVSDHNTGYLIHIKCGENFAPHAPTRIQEIQFDISCLPYEHYMCGVSALAKNNYSILKNN